MPFDWRLYLKLIGYSLRDARTPRRVGRVLFLALLCPSIVLFGSIGMLLDWVFFPGLRSTKVEKPVFVTGHARSGTSLMVKLLSRDRRMDWVMTYEMILPSIVQKRLVRWIAAVDAEYLGGALARRVTAFEDRLFEKGRQMHPMGLTIPEEDAFLLAATFLHAQIGLFFPYQREIDELFYFDQRTPRQKRRAMRFYADCIRRHLYTNGGTHHGLTFVSKNPTMVGALLSLRETFPDARFVVMMRNPYETIPSLLKMMVRNWRILGYQRDEVDEALQLLAKQCLYYYQYPFEALDDLPPERCAWVRYEELVDAPAKTIEALYAQLGIPMTPDYAAELEREESRSRKHRREHVYSLDEFGLTRAEIRDALPEAFERFGWDPPAPRAPETT
ncbi:MAG: sulfotransferase [Myxococcota bacterium]|nr:sulfotransferase [Myxococcales bacterium]